MFGIGGFNPVNLLATAALGPLGGIASQLLTQLASSVGQQILQSVGDKLGLPQSTIDLAQGAFAGSVGDFNGAQLNLSEAVDQLGNFYGASPADKGGVENQLNDAIDSLTTDLAQTPEAREARSSGGKSWLMALAQSLGEVADKLAMEMEDLSQNLGSGENKASQNVEFAAKSQEFNQFFSSAINVVKTLGEALASGSRKG